MVWYVAIFAVGCADTIPPPGAAMSGLDAGSMGATEAIREEVPTPDAGMADGSGEALATRAAPLVWEPGESWEPFLNFRNDSNVNHARHSHYGRAVALIQPSGCSAFLISRDRLVTAHHCTLGDTDITARFIPYESWSTLEADELLLQLGFQDATLRAAAVNTVLGDWPCSRHSKEPNRDIEYYTCWSVPIELRPGYFVALHPGDVFGHLDITTSHPANQASTNNLTVNSLVNDSNPVGPSCRRAVIEMFRSTTTAWIFLATIMMNVVGHKVTIFGRGHQAVRRCVDQTIGHGAYPMANGTELDLTPEGHRYASTLPDVRPIVICGHLSPITHYCCNTINASPMFRLQRGHTGRLRSVVREALHGLTPAKMTRRS
jgi:hypothetical protein